MKIRVAVWGTVGKSVLIDTDAGAQIGTNLRLPDGSVPTLDELKVIFGGGSGTNKHKDLKGLQVGDDHPQYTMWNAVEHIKAQWDFEKSVWGPNGTAALPAFTFTSDLNTGAYRVGADNLGISTNGVLRWDVGTTRVNQTLPLRIQSNSGMLVQNEGAEGTAGIEMLSFDGFDVEEECGNQLAFWESPDRTNGFRFRHNGEEDIVGDLLVFRHDNDLTGVEVLRILRDTTQVCIAAGSVTEPILAFIGDEDTGMYSGTADTIRFTCGGSQVIGVNGTVLNVNVPVRGPNGSAATPSFSFQNDTDSGLYDISDNSIGVSLAGVLRLTLTASQFTATVPWRGPNGSSSAPTFSFSGDTDTGVLSAGTNTLGISTGGQTRFELDTSKLLVNMDSVNVPADTLNADTDFAVAGNGGGKSLTIVSGGGGAVGVRCISSGDSLASPDAINVTDNSYLAFIGGAGYDGTNWQTGSAALFGVRPGSTWSGSNRESFLTFETTASGSTTRAERVRINGVGQILASAGTAALPEYSFSGDPNTGIFSDAADTIKFAANGAEVARLDANATAGNTRFLIYDVDNATLERVSVGAADSGGAGFKVLRIPN